MKEKLLFYLDDSFFHFGIANKLYKKFPELYAIIDMTFPFEKFLEKQSLVPFKKIFNLHKELYNFKKNPDVNYLKKFEDKYGINIWQSAFADGKLVNYNPYYQFNQNEILCIFEHECEFFENILENVKPNCLLTKTTDHHRIHSLYEMCKSLKIPTLTLSPSRIGYRMMITSDFDKIENDKKNPPTSSSKDFDMNIDSYFKKFNTFEQQQTRGESKSEQKSRKKNLFANLDDGNFYNNFGRTRGKILARLLKFKILRKRHSRQKFFDKFAIKKFDTNTPFVYFPLHVEPERTITLTQPFFRDQLEIITHIAKTLPINYKLYVKEHPFMLKTRSSLIFREISYYKKIISLPNVELIHPTLNPDEIYPNCSFVVTISGTSPIEAAFYEKPSIVFSDVSYSYLPFISRVRNIQELPNIIKKNLNQKFDFSELGDYVKKVHDNSFEIDFTSFLNSLRDFYDNYLVNNDNIQEKEVSSFLQKNESHFKKLAQAYLQKISQIKLDNTN